MADDDVWSFWLSIMGNSDDEESDFEGYTLEEIAKKDESDIDLDLVVNNDRLLAELAPSSTSTSDSDRSGSDLDGEVVLPSVVGPQKRKKRASKSERDAVTVRWRDRLQPVKTKSFLGTKEKDDDDDGEETVTVGVSHDLEVGASPYEYFSLIIPEDFWVKMSEETNRYATQRQQKTEKNDKDWTPSTPEEMKLFMYIQYMFGIHRLPESGMYWSTDLLLNVPAVSQVMSRNRYYKLCQYFHLSDNEKAAPKGAALYDPLYKVRPLLDAVLNNSCAHYYPGRDISVDEAMVKFNGKLSFKQYIKGKPNPWGIKICCAADPRSGYMLDFDVYLGRVAEPMPYGLGYHVIMKVGQCFLQKGHHLFFDNFFSSVKLAQDLEKKDTYITSTIRTNRKGWPKDFDSTLLKKMKVGDVHFQQDGNLVATVWRDKRTVSTLSTNSQPRMATEERRSKGGKKKVSVPVPVLTYNNSMGGVDLVDQHAAYYPVGRPSVRWWRYLCWWLFQIAMVNAFIIWKNSNLPQPTRRGLRHLNFRLEVLRSLSKGHSVRRHAAPQALSAAGVTDRDPLSYHPTRMPGLKKNCKVCEKARKKTAKGYSVTTTNGCAVCVCVKVHALHSFIRIWHTPSKFRLLARI